MAEATFDRASFEARLATRELGRTSTMRCEVASTNDLAWEAFASGGVNGAVFVADLQTRGRGRAGRSWHTPAAKGLALSVLLMRDGGARASTIAPLAAGLALARGLDGLGVTTHLKWPNDLLLAGRKVAGILCESRATSGASGLVIGVGVNVSQEEQDFPPELLRADGPTRPATSLRMEGHTLTREAIAAEFLNAFEPLWVELDRGPGAILEAWTRRASFWGEAVRIATPAGIVSGVARSLDRDGGLVVERFDGGLITVVAGDVAPAPREEGASSRTS